MLNSPTLAETNCGCSESIHMLIDLLKSLNNHNQKLYTIVEYFPKGEIDYTPKVYELTNLTMDEENGIVFCCDGDGKLCLKYGLFAFSMDDVIYVGFQEGCKVVTISFDYGYIRICY